MTNTPTRLRWYERPVLIGWFAAITAAELMLVFVALVR